MAVNVAERLKASVEHFVTTFRTSFRGGGLIISSNILDSPTTAFEKGSEKILKIFWMVRLIDDWVLVQQIKKNKNRHYKRNERVLAYLEYTPFYGNKIISISFEIEIIH